MVSTENNSVEIIHRITELGHHEYTHEPAGLSLFDIALKYNYGDALAWVRNDPLEATEWRQVPFDEWDDVYPETVDGEPGYMFTHSIHGGGENAQIFALIATVLLTIIAPGVGATLFGTGTFLARAATAAILAAGGYAIGKIFAPEPPAQIAADDPSDTNSYVDVTSDSNVIADDAFLPHVFGKRRILLPEIVTPRFYMKDGQQYVERLFAGYGHTDYSEGQISGTPITDFPGVYSEVRDGAPGSSISTFIDKINAFTNTSGELIEFSLDGSELEDQTTPANSSPTGLRFTTPYHEAMEEINIRMTFNGFQKADGAASSLTVPIRFRVRLRGGDADDWVNWPEIWVTGKSLQRSIIEFRQRPDGTFGIFSTGGELSFQYWREVPPVTAYPLADGNVGDQWVADSSFASGAGFQDVTNIIARRDGLEVTMGTDVLPLGDYEWEVMRGMAFVDGDVSSSYTYSGNVISLFVAWSVGGRWVVPIDQRLLPVTASLVHTTTIADVKPCQQPGTPLWALRAISQSIHNFSVLAEGYAMDYNESTGEWDTPTKTENPATWYRYLLYLALTHHGVDTSLIDENMFINWRSECILQGHVLSLVLSGESIGEGLQICASAGYGRPAFDHGFGIEYFKDRSEERPLAPISPVNTSSISAVFSHSELPSAVRVRFFDRSNNYKITDKTINNRIHSNTNKELSKTIRGLVNFDQIEMRETYDILQTYHRPVAWVCDMRQEHIGFQVGSLMMLVTDLENESAMGCRISHVIDPMTIVIDQVIPRASSDDVLSAPDFLDLENMFGTGDPSVIFFTTPTGQEMINIADVNDRTIRLVEPITGDISDLERVHATIGPVANFQKRCYVTSIDPDEDGDATVVLVDEAPQILDTMRELYGWQ